MTQSAINTSFCIIYNPKFASFLWNHEQIADHNGLIVFVIKHLSESARVTDNWRHIILQWSMPLMLLTSRFMLMMHLRALIISKTGCWKPSAADRSPIISADDRKLWNQIFSFLLPLKRKEGFIFMCYWLPITNADVLISLFQWQKRLCCWQK